MLLPRDPALATRRTKMLLEDKTAGVSGGAGSAGPPVAPPFAREGARVFLAGRTPATLDAVAAEISGSGGAVQTARVDALDERAGDGPAEAGAPGAGGMDGS